MIILYIQTQKKDQVIDVTEEIQGQLNKQTIKNCVVNLFVLHTTCCITTADLDPGTDLDLLDGLRNILPQLNYRHPHDPSHTPDHILSSIIGPSINIPVENGKIVLGTWQRIILIELDGPRKRKMVLSILK